MIATGAAASTILFMAAGCFLTVLFFVAAALIVVGYFKPSASLRKGGWIFLAIWSVPAAIWLYNLLILIERDQYRTLAKPEVVYGVPLPAGAHVNFHRWARRVQWATLPSPQKIEGIEYAVQVNFCGGHVCSGTLARDQEIEGLPCRAQDDVHFSEKTGRLTECTLSRSFGRQGVTWPAGTTVRLSADPGDSYVLPEGAAPVRAEGLLVHSGLIVWFSQSGRIVEIDRNQARAGPDTQLEIGDVVLKSEVYRFEQDGTIHGGVLEHDAVVNGKLMKAGEPVVIHPH